VDAHEELYNRFYEQVGGLKDALRAGLWEEPPPPTVVLPDDFVNFWPLSEAWKTAFREWAELANVDVDVWFMLAVDGYQRAPSAESARDVIETFRGRPGLNIVNTTFNAIHDTLVDLERRGEQADETLFDAAVSEVIRDALRERYATFRQEMMGG
jgi:hypothetical protein